MNMKNWLIHGVEFNGYEENVKKLMRKFRYISLIDPTNVNVIDLVPKKNINLKLFKGLKCHPFDGVSFISELPLINELKEIADYYKVNFELQYSCWDNFNFGRMDYFYQTQKENSILFNDDLNEIKWNEENQVYKYEDAEFKNKIDLERYIFDRAVRAKQIDLILEQLK